MPLLDHSDHPDNFDARHWYDAMHDPHAQATARAITEAEEAVADAANAEEQRQDVECELLDAQIALERANKDIAALQEALGDDDGSELAAAHERITELECELAACARNTRQDILDKVMNIAKSTLEVE